MRRNNDAFDIVTGIVMTLVLFSILVGVGTQFLRTLKAIHDEQLRKENTITTQTVKLVSLDYTSEIEGKFHGFSLGLSGSVNGTISEASYYVAYQVLEDGGKSLYKIPANITILYDTLENGQDGYAEVDINDYGTTKAIRLYVPKGTVPHNYDVSIN